MPDPFAEVRLVTLRTVRGPNYWSPFPVTRLDLAVGAYEEIPSDGVPGLTESLAGALPGLVEHRCSIGERGGFLTRLRRGTYIPHIVEHLALELQSAAGHDVGFGRARGGDREGEYTVVYEHRHAAVGRRAGILALELAQRAFAGAPLPIEAALAELKQIGRIPDEPELPPVTCGVFGGAVAEAVREEMIRRAAGQSAGVVAVSPDSVLMDGLPYSRSRIAVIAEVSSDGVPHRYRDRDAARRLASVPADAVPRNGLVVVPAREVELQEMVREAGRTPALFAVEGDGESFGRPAVAPFARSHEGEILIDSPGRAGEALPLRAGIPAAAQVAAALAAHIIESHDKEA